VEIKLELYTAKDFEAFSVFAQSLANARKVDEADKLRYATLGGIDRASNPHWGIAGAMTATEALIRASVGQIGEATEDKPAEEPKKATRTRKAKAEEPAAISTGEERVGPEDDEVTAQQDKADEQAEVEAAREPEKPLTADDLRQAMGEYVTAHGMPATQEDGPSIFADALGTPPDGEQFWKLTVVAGQGQERLKTAIDAWKSAAAAAKRYKKVA
jgi:hypothetical protein